MQKLKPLVLILLVALAAGAVEAQTAEGQKDKEKAKGRAETPAPDAWAFSMPMSFGEGSYLGVYLEEVTSERAKELGLKEERGALVMKVVEGSPAEKAGLKENDTIISFNGRRVDSVREMQTHVGRNARGPKCDDRDRSRRQSTEHQRHFEQALLGFRPSQS